MIKNYTRVNAPALQALLVKRYSKILSCPVGKIGLCTVVIAAVPMTLPPVGKKLLFINVVLFLPLNKLAQTEVLLFFPP